MRIVTLPPVTASEPSWSPDGGSLLFSSDREGERAIYLLRLDTLDVVRVTSRGEPAHYPVWSPTHQRLAYASKMDRGWSLCVRELPLGSRRCLLETGGLNPKRPDWSPDGDRLVVAASEGGDRALVVVPLADGDPVRLDPLPAEEDHPAWSPDGSTIAFSAEEDGDRDLYLLDVHDGALERLTREDGYDGFPTWSPDGASLAFVSTRDGFRAIHVMDMDSREVHRLTADDGRAYYPNWSPDGARIVFMSNRDGDEALFVVGRGGGEIRRVTPRLDANRNE